MQFHGGFGFANEYDVERKFRETRLYQVAPISTNLILSYVAEHLLGLPRSSERARPTMKPLEGITVVTLEHAIAAPFCTRQLADLGARVIKVERPGSGDFARGYDSRVKGLASHFVWTNRAKESLTLDLKHADAPAILERLLERADVLVQNLAPGRRGADRACRTRRCAEQHPKLDRLRHLRLRRRPERPGPYRDKKAYDLLIQSESGFLSITGTPDEPCEGRLLDRRHRRRHVRLQQHPRRADRARPHRQRPRASTCRCSRAWSSG